MDKRSLAEKRGVLQAEGKGTGSRDLEGGGSEGSSFIRSFIHSCMRAFAHKVLAVRRALR